MTLTETDILDEVDALLDAREDEFPLDRAEDLDDAARAILLRNLRAGSASSREVFEDYGDNTDPSPMCNCGECTKGNYTCIRQD